MATLITVLLFKAMILNVCNGVKLLVKYEENFELGEPSSGFTITGRGRHSSRKYFLILYEKKVYDACNMMLACKKGTTSITVLPDMKLSTDVTVSVLLSSGAESVRARLLLNHTVDIKVTDGTNEDTINTKVVVTQDRSIYVHVLEEDLQRCGLSLKQKETMKFFHKGDLLHLSDMFTTFSLLN